MDGVKQTYGESLKQTFRSLKWYEWLMAAVMILIALKAMIRAFVSPAEGGNPPWLTVVNFISAVAGVFCVFFCAKASVSNYAFGLVNTVVYIIYLWYWRIYGTLCLELFLYLPMGVIGWIQWARHRDDQHRELTKARKLRPWLNAVTAGVILAATVVYHEVLVRVGGTAAWFDAAAVAIGIAATALQTLRYREQYIWWIITDVVTVALYIQHFDPVYLTKRIIYLIVAVIGMVNWIRLSKKNKENL